MLDPYLGGEWHRLRCSGSSKLVLGDKLEPVGGRVAKLADIEILRPALVNLGEVLHLTAIVGINPANLLPLAFVVPEIKTISNLFSNISTYNAYNKA